MLICKHGSPIEPLDSTLLRLDELAAAINTTAKQLTPTDARAIKHELNAVARTLKRADYLRLSRRSAVAAATISAQGNLLG
ncbi:hypothetical protein [Ralstonia insidiosa]|uniref:hypothetical protein n=1 Tax=Ralstonia insidiosa TaxID=190721 RepID=UPI000CEEBCA6|nr:hypothetical protein [Ralstonia insidiosa]